MLGGELVFFPLVLHEVSHTKRDVTENEPLPLVGGSFRDSLSDPRRSVLTASLGSRGEQFLQLFFPYKQGEKLLFWPLSLTHRGVFRLVDRVEEFWTPMMCYILLSLVIGVWTLSS